MVNQKQQNLSKLKDFGSLHSPKRFFERDISLSNIPTCFCLFFSSIPEPDATFGSLLSERSWIEFCFRKIFSPVRWKRGVSLEYGLYITWLARTEITGFFFNCGGPGVNVDSFFSVYPPGCSHGKWRLSSDYGGLKRGPKVATSGPWVNHRRWGWCHENQGFPEQKRMKDSTWFNPPSKILRPKKNFSDLQEVNVNQPFEAENHPFVSPPQRKNKQRSQGVSLILLFSDPDECVKSTIPLDHPGPPPNRTKRRCSSAGHLRTELFADDQWPPI